MSDFKTEFRHQPGRGTIWREPADKPSAWSGTVTLPDGSQAWLTSTKPQTAIPRTLDRFLIH